MRKTAFITGASSGIGASLAIVGAKLGYNLVLMARNAEGLELTAKHCRELGAQVALVQGDVSIEADCKRAVDTALTEFQGIDVLINNAGISMRAVFADTEPEVLKKLMDINFWGTVYCTNTRYLRYCNPRALLLVSPPLLVLKDFQAAQDIVQANLPCMDFLKVCVVKTLKQVCMCSSHVQVTRKATSAILPWIIQAQANLKRL